MKDNQRKDIFSTYRKSCLNLVLKRFIAISYKKIYSHIKIISKCDFTIHKTQMINTSIKTGMKIEAVILNTFTPQTNQMLEAGQHLELEGLGKVQLLYITDLSVRVLKI